MSSLLIAVIATVVVVWATVAVIVAVVVGRSISLAEQRESQQSQTTEDPVFAQRS